MTNKKIRGVPIFKIETPKKGIASRAAGTRPIKVLIIAVNVSAAIISLSFMLTTIILCYKNLLNKTIKR